MKTLFFILLALLALDTLMCAAIMVPAYFGHVSSSEAMEWFQLKVFVVGLFMGGVLLALLAVVGLIWLLARRRK